MGNRIYLCPCLGLNDVIVPIIPATTTSSTTPTWEHNVMPYGWCRTLIGCGGVRVDPFQIHLNGTPFQGSLRLQLLFDQL